MKRFTAILFILLTLAITSAGCTRAVSPQNDKISIVCTIFPQYDWVRQILGNNIKNADLTLLLSGGGDLHSYQPSVEDIAKISSADLFIYVGGESDGWVKDTLKEAVNPDMVVINLLETMGTEAKLEEIIEGMEDEDHEREENAANDHEAVYDEHVWLSLKNARTLCAAVTEALSSLDAGNTGMYRDNLAAYDKKLSSLDAEYHAAATAASVKTLLFGDRFPFRYLVDDYGLSYYAAFPGCSAETEASFETIVFLANKVDESGLKTVITLESSDQSIANTIINNTSDKSRQIIVMNSIQSVTADDVRKGVDYLSVMESNLSVLKEALR